jgi:hypothetical protein
MMSVSLSFGADLHRELVAHLRATENEQVAFLFTEPAVLGEPLRVAQLYRVPPEGFERQSSFHVTLADEVRGHVIGRAWQLGGSLVEVHSHEGGSPASFSHSDMSGFEEWVPHVRWRLPDRAYVALVFADDSFDALVWDDGHEGPRPLAGVIIDGRAILAPTGITYSRLSKAPRGR